MQMRRSLASERCSWGRRFLFCLERGRREREKEREEKEGKEGELKEVIEELEVFVEDIGEREERYRRRSKQDMLCGVRVVREDGGGVEWS